MMQKTNENKPIPCMYQELNPEMEDFLAAYLEDGRRRGLQESTIHLHDKIGHYFLSAVTKSAAGGISPISGLSSGMLIIPDILAEITAM